MSELIAARAKGELLDRYEDEKDRLGEDETESELVRDLLDRGLRDRRVPLVARLDLPNRVGARIEDERERGESEEEVVRRFLREAVDARDADTLDAIGADEELRELVEARREEGEPLDDTVRRLLRDSVEKETRGGGPFAWVVPRFALLAFALTLFIPVFGEATLQAFAFGGAATLAPTATALGGGGRRLDNAVDAGREAVAHGAGAVAGFLGAAKNQFYEDHPAPASPTTLVERLAWLDVYSYYVGVAFTVFAGVLFVVVETAGAQAVFETLGAWGTLGVVWLVVLGAYLYIFMQLTASLAQLAIASARGDVSTDTAEVGK
jgi:hypothetical protein